MTQLELDFSEDPSRLVFPNLRQQFKVPGCPRCEGDLITPHGLCWDHQNEERRREQRFFYLLSDEEWRQELGIIETMKRDILEAAAAGRPMPWSESEGMTGSERAAFRRRIHIAMRETGCCIVAPPQEETSRPKRKRAP